MQLNPVIKLAAAQIKMLKNVLNIAFRDGKINIWVRERTNVTEIIKNARELYSAASKTTEGQHVSPAGDRAGKQIMADQ